MDYCEYYLCDVCDAKAFYDGGRNYELDNVGEMKVLCLSCAKTHQVIVVERGVFHEPPEKPEDFPPTAQ